MEKVVLFTQKNSIYESLGCTCYNEENDALTYMGTSPVIAHPPCRAWGRYANSRAKPVFGEKDLALYALDLVNTNGGVLEHPRSSSLWKMPNLSTGFILPIKQYDFGHRAEKFTNLYIVGITPNQLPPIPLTLGKSYITVEDMGRKEREKTPLDLAVYLIKILEVINNEKTL